MVFSDQGIFDSIAAPEQIAKFDHDRLCIPLEHCNRNLQGIWRRKLHLLRFSHKGLTLV